LNQIISQSGIQNNWDFSNQSTLTLAGSKISAIQDTGNEELNLSQSTDNRRPFLIENGLNGLSVAEFGVTNDGSLVDFLFTTTTVIPSNVYTIFLVARANDNSSAKELFNRRTASTGVNYAVRYNNSETIQLLVANSSSTTYTFPTNIFNNLEWKVVSLSRSSSNVFTANQSNSNSNSANNAIVPSVSGTHHCAIGANSINSTTAFFGQCAEIIVINRTITTTESDQIFGLLAHKWGLRLSLPSSDPYRNFPPFI
jgi:hypothetical protein